MSARASAVSVLPTPLGPTSRKTPIGRRGSVRLARAVRMRWAIASRACDWPMTRSSSWSSSVRTVWISSVTILPTGMPVQPETTSAIVWRVDADLHQRVLALELAQLVRPGLEVGLERLDLGRRASASACDVAPSASPLPAAWCRSIWSRRSRICSTSARSCVPALLQLVELRLGLPELLDGLGEPFVVPGAGDLLALEDADLDLEVLDPRLAVLDGRRRRVLAERDAGAGGVEQADRLVGQLPAGDVAVREPDRRLDRLVEDADLVVLLERRRRARAS